MRNASLMLAFLSGDLQQPVVGDGDQRVDAGLTGFDGLLRAAAALRPLEGEGPRDHADGQRAHLPRHLRHDGRGARAGAAAHAGGHEDHVGAAEHLAQFLAALLRRALADVRVAARPSPLVIFSPMRSRCGAPASINAWASVLTAMNSTP
jgi:hypothetical protein